MAPRISVLLPVRDAEATLPAALASLRAQSLEGFEVVAVDDGSVDGSLALLEAAARDDTRLSLQDFIEGAIATALRQSSGPPAIHSTLRRDFWVYEILEPVASLDGWQAEIRRAPRDSWRPGSGGPFYVVLGRTPQDALAEARGFVHRHG